MAVNQHIAASISTGLPKIPKLVSSKAKPTQWEHLTFTCPDYYRHNKANQAHVTEAVSHTDENRESSYEELRVNRRSGFMLEKGWNVFKTKLHQITEHVEIWKCKLLRFQSIRAARSFKPVQKS